jgi:succinate-semialdehyde dehydrogenase/glutarate-semialdehyde dehydrogenase
VTRTRPVNADELVARLLPLVIASSGATASVMSPLDGQQVCAMPISNEQDVDHAFRQARSAFAAWSKTSLSERIAIIDRFHDLVLDNAETLLDIAQWENGKTRGNAADEMIDIALTCRYYARTARKSLKPQRRRGAFPLATVTHEHHLPLGVIGVISPWNYPLTLAVSDFIPALLAGNTVVTKPDLQTPLCALVLIDLLHQAGLPRNVVQVVMGEGADVGPLVTDRADFVMFTGSTRVGREVARRAGERLIDSSMELGGKNSLIVGRNVNLDNAVATAVRGAFANSGQLCIGTERIVVHVDLYEAFMEKFRSAVSAMKVGSEIGWGADMGTLINERQIATTERHIADAVSRGAVLEVGGHRLPEVGPFAFAPTVLSNVPADAEVCSNETFGPVCSVYTWRADEDLVAFVNNTEYGLSAGIVSRDIGWANQIANQLKVGGVNINEAFGSAYASIDAPMGGMGQSGLGRRHGLHGILKYTAAQTVARQRFMKLTPQWNLDDRGWAAFAMRAIRILKVLRFK